MRGMQEGSLPLKSPFVYKAFDGQYFESVSFYRTNSDNMPSSDANFNCSVHVRVSRNNRP